MKRKIISVVIGLMLAFSALAVAGPYFEFEQGLIPDAGFAVPTGRIVFGALLSFSNVVEKDCPQPDPCGVYEQYTTVGVCLDLFAGLNDFWVVPWSPFFGVDFLARWNFIALDVRSEIGFDDAWGGWPLATGDIEYWDTNVAFGFYINEWFRFWAGADFVWESDHLNPWPFFRFRIGDQGGCADVGCLK